MSHLLPHAKAARIRAAAYREIGRKDDHPLMLAIADAEDLAADAMELEIQRNCAAPAATNDQE